MTRALRNRHTDKLSVRKPATKQVQQQAKWDEILQVTKVKMPTLTGRVLRRWWRRTPWTSTVRFRHCQNASKFG